MNSTAIQTGILAVLGIGALAIMGWLRVPPEGMRSNRLEGDAVLIGSTIAMYAVNNDRPPTTAQGLEALVDRPTVGPEPWRWSKIMDRIPLDPWNHPYEYRALAPKQKEWRWEIRSRGPDGLFGTRDDFIYEGGSRRASESREIEQESHPSF